MTFPPIKSLLTNLRAAPSMRVDTPGLAIAHDYLTQRGGAERVVLSMHRAFPTAPIYTTFYDPDLTFPEFQQAVIITSPLNRIGFLRRHVRSALPLLPFMAHFTKVPGDLVLASSTGWAHGFRSDGPKLVYCHSPARWLYLSRQYLGGPLWSSPKGWALAFLRPFLVHWDQKAATSPVAYVSNSRVVAERVKNIYGRIAPVIPPPHSFDVSGKQDPIPEISPDVEREGFFLIVSRLLPYKNVQVAMEAFRDSQKNLIIVGSGPLRDQILRDAPQNVFLLSNLSDPQMRWLYSRSQAIIAPSYEDFGITPLEGAAYGKPTIALRAGGYLDTIVEGVTGTFMETVSVDAIRRAVEEFLSDDWDADTIKRHAHMFSESVFHGRLLAAVNAIRQGREVPRDFA